MRYLKYFDHLKIKEAKSFGDLWRRLKFEKFIELVSDGEDALNCNVIPFEKREIDNISKILESFCEKMDISMKLINEEKLIQLGWSVSKSNKYDKNDTFIIDFKINTNKGLFKILPLQSPGVGIIYLRFYKLEDYWYAISSDFNSEKSWFYCDSTDGIEEFLTWYWSEYYPHRKNWIKLKA
jgi:hypothetical protein